VRTWARERLAAYKVPQEIHVMRREDLPLTSTGKVQKFRLAEHLAATRGNAFRGGFLHVPSLLQQAAGGAPGLALDDIVSGIAIVLEASAAAAAAD